MLGYFAGVKWPLQLNLDQLHNQRGGCVKAQPGSAYANVLAEAESMAQSSRSECLFNVASFNFPKSLKLPLYQHLYLTKHE